MVMFYMLYLQTCIHIYFISLVAELNEKANEMMMLKFGRIVNLDALEGLTTNKLIGELELTLKEAEMKYEHSKLHLEVIIA